MHTADPKTSMHRRSQCGLIQPGRHFYIYPMAPVSSYTLPPSCFVLLQIRGMHTIIRDAQTSKNDFVFFADRLSRLVVEAGLGHLPFTEKTVITPTGGDDDGVTHAE